MFDKWKIRQELCKAHNMYRKKVTSFLHSTSYTYDEYEQLKEIEYAIAYVLCEYFDFNYEFYYDYFPYGNRWYIAWDYLKYYDECKKAYEKITKQNKTNYIAQSINDFKGNYSIGDVIMINGRLYCYNGKYFINIC